MNNTGNLQLFCAYYVWGQLTQNLFMDVNLHKDPVT